MNDTTLETFYRAPSWSTGHISQVDAAFVDATIRRVRPTDVIEIGVASGCSSAVLLRAIDGVGLDGTLHSYDLLDCCYFDPSRAVGSAVDEIAPHLKHRWRLRPKKIAVDAGQELAGAGIRVAFVDAHHGHPWPTVDAMALLPALADDAWIILHDINLPRFYFEESGRQFGALYLFDGWPGEKVRVGGKDDNIGAIRLLGDRERSREALLDVLSIPWDARVDESVCAIVLGSTTWKRANVRLAEKLTQTAREGRPIAMWGAGGLGRGYKDELAKLDIPLVAVIDGDAAKHGQTIGTTTIVGPEWLSGREPRPFIVIASSFHREIATTLFARGFVAGCDFAVVEYV